jgi:hypothetical protein
MEAATSARRVRKGTGSWSEHAYGRAVDLNRLRTPTSAVA